VGFKLILLRDFAGERDKSTSAASLLCLLLTPRVSAVPP